jgi:hypothetical protein
MNKMVQTSQDELMTRRIGKDWETQKQAMPPLPLAFSIAMDFVQRCIKSAV